jgi:hypothetical protein
MRVWIVWVYEENETQNRIDKVFNSELSAEKYLDKLGITQTDRYYITDHEVRSF